MRCASDSFTFIFVIKIVNAAHISILKSHVVFHDVHQVLAKKQNTCRNVYTFTESKERLFSGFIPISKVTVYIMYRYFYKTRKFTSDKHL